MTGVACASYSNVRFAPAIQDTELRGEADDVEARIVVAWRGIKERDDVPELRFRVRVENPGPTPFTLVPAAFELLDAALTSFGDAATDALPTAVEPGGSVTFEIAFPVSGAKALEGFDLSALTLRTRFQGERWSWNTTFQRAVRAYDDPYYEPHWGFHFGWVISS
jgi:hypothetical protein